MKDWIALSNPAQLSAAEFEAQIKAELSPEDLAEVDVRWSDPTP